jgi:protein-disulfide isomerase
MRLILLRSLFPPLLSILRGMYNTGCKMLGKALGNLLATHRLKALVWLVVMLLGWALPGVLGGGLGVAQAAPKVDLIPKPAALRAIDPQLEAQVLDILRRHPEVILESVQHYQETKVKEARQAQQAVLKRFQRNPQAAIGPSPQLGNGKVILFEFSDFQCPFCAEVRATLKQFVQQNPDRVSLVYKHFPLASIHPEAVAAARAAWAAQQQGQFWPYHDALFEQQPQLGDRVYRQIAASLNLDLTRWQRDRTSPAAAQALAQDLQLGEQLGIDGTPFFVLDDVAFSGAVPLAELETRLAQVKS